MALIHKQKLINMENKTKKKTTKSKASTKHYKKSNRSAAVKPKVVYVLQKDVKNKTKKTKKRKITKPKRSNRYAFQIFMTLFCAYFCYATYTGGLPKVFFLEHLILWTHALAPAIVEDTFYYMLTPAYFIFQYAASVYQSYKYVYKRAAIK